MRKFKVPSWLMSQSPDAEQKKENRRSFSGFSQFRSKHESLPARKSVAVDESQPRQQSNLLELARRITAETEKLETYVRNNGLPEPSFALGAPDCLPRLPADMQRCRQEIIHATKELETLVRGPKETVRWTIWNCLDTLSLQIINGYGIARLVPVDSPIPLTELQAKTSLDPINLARVLRHAMTNYIFHEPEPGLIAHTAASRELAQDAALQDWVGFNGEDLFPSAAKVLDSLKAHPEATSLTTTGFNFAFDTIGKEPMFVTFGKDGARARRMGGAMASLTEGEGYEVDHFKDNYDMSEIDEKGGTFVDIGGSHGFVCVDLAKKWKKMTFVVQDLPKTVDSAPKPVCDDESVAARIQLQAHDFFEEQPVKGADVYFFRWIIHNYSTPYAVKLLKNLVPALKPGSRVVINDHCLRDPGAEKPWDEKLIRGMDMVMLTLLNAQEREEHEFRALFRAADERFVFKGVTRTEGCRMSIIEAVWEPGEIKVNGRPSKRRL
ncbi:o-methyltransferase [Hirsutella rhossiliensis]|uniref:O-methyltransferase domain-containing protein n=1 Tax=Hirsutella rhossiliensis TaxID=111463 RepID=A0A9P8N3K4_9HYPO|nr:o-methyltransferase domain-containing protein [Hirsutella rhossiliensis]KAH0964062.1 o-methyltransferase domain-containing protein [Hirsutella rhossiliensis]